MEIYTVKKDTPLFLKDNYALTLGFFDGLHKGHQQLFKEVLKVSKEKNLIPALMTFDNHPLSILKNEKTTRLTSLEDKIKIASSLGINTIFIIEFTKEVAKLSPSSFINEYFLSNNIKHVVVGEDFRFGYKNSGNINDLKHNDFSLSIIKPLMYDENKKISSTLIKEKLSLGQIEEANTLLTRPFTIYGEVIHGKKRGRLLGFPTANINYGHYYMPLRGVYGVKFYVNNNVYIAMANIGKNPTFNDIDHESLEIHLFDFNEDIYGENVKVEFYVFERAETKFENIEELKNRLTKDKDIVSMLMKEK